MLQAYKHRPQDFKRRILKTQITNRPKTYEEELRWLKMIKLNEIKIRYYNLNIKNNEAWYKYPEHIKTISEKMKASFTPERKNQYRQRMLGNTINVGKKYSEERCQKISNAQKGRSDVRSAEGKEKHRQALTGKPSLKKGTKENLTLEQRKKISETSKMTSSKMWKITTPDNQIQQIRNLKQFCIDHQLTYGDYQMLKKSAINTCKGYISERC